MSLFHKREEEKGERLEGVQSEAELKHTNTQELASLQRAPVQLVHWLFGAHKHGLHKLSSSQICTNDARCKLPLLSALEVEVVDFVAFGQS